MGHFQAERYAAAIAWCDKAAQRMGYQPRTHFFLASCHALLGQPDDAGSHLAAALEAVPEATIAKARRLPFEDPADDERFRDGLRKAGLPD